MSEQQYGPAGNQPTKVVYTCWPYGRHGTTICGIALIAFGALSMLDRYVMVPSEIVWGVGLIALGVVTIAFGRRHTDW